MDMIVTLRQLLRVVLNISDNSMLKGRTKYNQIDRAIDAVMRHCSESDWSNDEMNEASEMIQRYQDALGQGGWRLKRAIERIHMNL